MKIIKQIFIILLFYVIGEAISHIVELIFPSIFIPGTIIGMILLLTFLITEKIKLEHVNEVGTFLTSNMAFFFIPAAVSVIEYIDILKSVFLKIILIVIISTVINFFVIAWVVKMTIKWQAKLSVKGEK